jgi:hypothetical protein
VKDERTEQTDLQRVNDQIAELDALYWALDDFQTEEARDLHDGLRALKAVRRALLAPVEVPVA